MGSRVTILERRSDRMRYLDEIMPHVETLMAEPMSVRSAVTSADILIGAVHIPAHEHHSSSRAPWSRK